MRGSGPLTKVSKAVPYMHHHVMVHYHVMALSCVFAFIVALLLGLF